MDRGRCAALIATYVEAIRNTPLLVQLFIVFFGLPSVGLRFSATTAAVVTLTINLGAYATEIVRAGLEAVPKAQREAGHALGLSGLQVFRHIILFPSLQMMYPALASQFILLMLATSITSQIAVTDLFHVASIIQSRTFRDFEVYTVVGVLYLALALVVPRLLRRPLPARVRPPMIREFGWIDVLYLVLAMRWTIALTATAFVGGALIGILVAVLRVSRVWPLQALAIVYTQAIQGTPLLVLLFVFFFGLSIVGLPVLPWIAAALAFSIYAGAFLGEIWRGALQSIAKTQWEAGAALGLGFAEQLRHIIVPQAVRIAIPPTVGFLVQLIKNTSLAATIGFVELTREGQLTTASTFQPFAVYLTVALLYFLMCFPLTQWSRKLERRTHGAA